MNTVKTAFAGLALITITSLSFASGTDLYVAEAQVPFSKSPQEAALTAKAINTLNKDNKIKGTIIVESRGDTVLLSGNVDTVAMLYRSVELIRDGNDIQNVSVRGLETN